MPTNPPVTQPGYGGSNPNQSEGPLRSGLIPRKITYPFAAPPFYTNQLKQSSHRKSNGVTNKLNIKVRHKAIQLAAGGVFGLFARGH